MSHSTSESSRYDRQILTALFDSRTDAQNAVDRLAAEGIERSDISLVEGSSTTGTVTEGAAYDRTSSEHKGFWEKLGDFFMPDEDRYTYAEGLNRGGYLVTVTATAANRERVLDILDDEGTVNLDEREASWRAEGWQGYEAGTSDYDSAAVTGGTATGLVSDRTVSSRTTSGYDTTRDVSLSDRDLTLSDSDIAASRLDADRAGTIDVVEEQIRVGKRDVNNGRVRVRSYVVEEPVSEAVSLRQERVEIERRPVDRAVTGADAFRDQTIELEETSQEAVVSKTARVKEEINLNKNATERTETISDTVRHTEVEIEDERSGEVLKREQTLTGTTGRPLRDSDL